MVFCEKLCRLVAPAAIYLTAAVCPAVASGSIVGWGTEVVGVDKTGVVAVSAGESHTLGLLADGSVVAWGSNWSDECVVPSPALKFASISAGSCFSLGLTKEGSVLAWGADNVMQCDVPSPNSGFTAISAGRDHSLGLKSDGSVVAWGSDWGPRGFGEAPVSATSPILTRGLWPLRRGVITAWV